VTTPNACFVKSGWSYHVALMKSVEYPTSVTDWNPPSAATARAAAKLLEVFEEPGHHWRRSVRENLGPLADA
jgi:hypothetical protein